MRSPLLILFSAILLLPFFRLWATNIVVSGNASGNWTVDTVMVMGDLTIPADSTLTVNPGVLVEFFGHYQIMVKGMVIANGTSGQMIRFSVNDSTGFTDTLSAAGGWHGFFYDHLLSSTDSSVFSHCIFEYGKAAVSSDTAGLYGGAFRIFNFGKIRFSDCRFENNLAYRWGGAVYAKYSNIVIENCNLINNHCGKATSPYGYGGALCFVHSTPRVQYNYFEKNRSTGIGGAASFEYSDAIVRYNVFYQNKSGLGGAVGYMRSQPANIISNNLMNQNTAIYFGGAIACIRTNAKFANNTIVNNLAMYGGAFYANDSACPSNYNTIFYNDWAPEGEEVYIFDIISAPNFYYCNVPGGKDAFSGGGGHQGYHGQYENNYDTVPMFSGTGEFPYELLEGSPLIDAGMPDTTGLQIPLTDLAGNGRIYNGTIDPGAFEWFPGVGLRGFTRQSGINVSPNPCLDQVMITFNTGKAGPVVIRIIDLKGNMVRLLGSGFYDQGKNSLDWDLKMDSGKRVEPGIYICLLDGGQWKDSALIEVVK